MAIEGHSMSAAVLGGPAIIAGFGVPGRAIAEWMESRHIPYIVVDQNEQIVERCSETGTPIIFGDVSNEDILKKANIERATVFAITVPVESVVLAAIQAARRLNPTIHILARCTYISAGLQAHRLGANETIVAEEIAAQEFIRRFDDGIARQK